MPPPPCFHVLAEAVVIWHRKLQNSTSVSHSKLTPLLTGSPAMRTVLIKKDNKIRLDGGTRQTDRRRYGRWHTRTVQSRTHRRRSGCRSRPLSRTPPSGPDAGRRAAPVQFPPCWPTQLISRHRAVPLSGKWKPRSPAREGDLHGEGNKRGRAAAEQSWRNSPSLTPDCRGAMDGITEQQANLILTGICL